MELCHHGYIKATCPACSSPTPRRVVLPTQAQPAEPTRQFLPPDPDQYNPAPVGRNKDGVPLLDLGDILNRAEDRVAESSFRDRSVIRSRDPENPPTHRHGTGAINPGASHVLGT